MVKVHTSVGSAAGFLNRLPGSSSVLQTVTVTAKLLVWKDYQVGHLDPQKGVNSIIPSQVDAIITEALADGPLNGFMLFPHPDGKGLAWSI